MKNVLIYSGTTEGRMLAKTLSGSGIGCEVCVATEYGEWVMEPDEHIRVRVGRQNPEEMKRLLKEGSYAAVVDATHPYALAVTRQIQESLQDMDIPYLRLQRNTQVEGLTDETIRVFSSAEECALALEETEGNILLTTGSKDLEIFTAKEEVTKRIYARVLPGRESLALCERAGLMGKQIIAMQGPFSREMNLALLHQFGIRFLVTKESGRTGGLEEKLEAAKEAGAGVFLIGNPELRDGHVQGYTLPKVLEQLERLLDTKITPPMRRITLVGIGMGSPESLTLEVQKAIQRANYVLGAKRLLQQISDQKEKADLYLAEDILPYLEERNAQDGGVGDVVILFSGDTGFYSGTEKLYRALKEKGYENVTILPGISSISALSAKTGISWQDAALFSLHGKRTGEWEAEATDLVRWKQKSFFLLSGKKQLTQFCRLLKEEGLEHVMIAMGHQMSYPEETYRFFTPAEWFKEEEQFPDAGLYTILVRNPEPLCRSYSYGYPDGHFLRGKVPMTKEEIRSIVISKMRLEGTDDQMPVVYDIGSGTGSVAVEIAMLSPRIRVYAVECKEEACRLTATNVARFGRENLTLIQGMAPKVLLQTEDIPAPTHAFIGGSRGHLGEILDFLYAQNPTVRVVITAVSLETVAELSKIPEQYAVTEFEMLNVQVSRTKKLGEHQLMQAENPVMICSFRFVEDET